MEIEDHVVAGASQPAAENQVLPECAPPPPSWRDDDLVQVGVGLYNRTRGGLDQVCKVGVGEAAPKRMHRGRRKDYIADLSKPDDEDAHGFSIREGNR
jgi:hypothetical protein